MRWALSIARGCFRTSRREIRAPCRHIFEPWRLRGLRRTIIFALLAFTCAGKSLNFAMQALLFVRKAFNFAIQALPFVRKALIFAIQALPFVRKALIFAIQALPFVRKAFNFAMQALPFVRKAFNFEVQALPLAYKALIFVLGAFPGGGSEKGDKQVGDSTFLSLCLKMPMENLYLSCLNLYRFGIIEHVGFLPPENHPTPNIFENSNEHQQYRITEYGINFYDACNAYQSNRKNP